MRNRTSFKHRKIYVFIIVLSLIGFVSGFKYYSYQPKDVKNNIKQNLNIKQELKQNVNNIPKRIKSTIYIFLASIFVLSIVLNVFKIFFDCFSMGFLFNTLLIYKMKFSILYILVYQFIPFLISMILIRVGFSISKTIIGLIIYKKDKSLRKRLKMYFKKYLLIFLILIIYEIGIVIYSQLFNSYLLTLI